MTAQDATALYESLLLSARVLGLSGLALWVLVAWREGKSAAWARVFACAGVTAAFALVALAFSLHPGWDVVPPPSRRPVVPTAVALEIGPEGVAALAVLPTIACGWVTREFHRILKVGDFRSLDQLIGLGREP